MENHDPEEKHELLRFADLDECQAALEEAQREAGELRDKYLRAAAQVENVRKWTERETLARAKENQRSLLRRLLEVMDNLERALSRPAEPAALYQGVQLTRRELEKVLAQAGVERIPVEPDQPFDPLFHEAVEVRRADNVDEPAIAAVVKPGYLHENELLRPAAVVVARQAS